MAAGINTLSKAPSGITGLDEITGGGLPRGRASLICGGAGSGKTLFALTHLVEGALKYGEPGAFICFEETEEELAANVASLGFDLKQLIASNKLAVDYVHVERSEIEETGEYDLDGLFVRIDYAIKSVGAKRVALDTIEALFSGLSNTGVLRAELRRLFRWLKDQGVTSVITAERGDGVLTRHGLEEYVSDCVIVLDHRVADQVATRRLRVVKYRGASHGTNEYPFLIDAGGIGVLPVTSVELAHDVSNERVSTGVAGLDAMLGGEGFWRGSSVLVSGMAGTGKTTLAAAFVDAACRRGERAIYFAFEESPHQIVRNMRSVGVDLQPWIDAGLLRFSASRPTLWGLEMHLARMHKEVETFAPQVVAIDPIYNLSAVGSATEVRMMLLRLIDYLKSKTVTALLTAADAGDVKDIGACGSLLADGRLAARADDRRPWRAQPRPLCHQGARDRPLQPDSRVPSVRSGYRPARGVSRSGRGSHRLGPRRPGGARKGKGDRTPIGRRRGAARDRAQAPADRGAGRGAAGRAGRFMPSNPN